MGMRVFGGIEITEEFVKYLSNEWKANANMPTSYERFMCANTGWTHDEFVQWVANGRLP